MPTTIQISETTLQILKGLKEEEEASSYDEVIRHLAQKHTRVPKSMFGSAKGMKWNKSTDRMDFHEL